MQFSKNATKFISSPRAGIILTVLLAVFATLIATFATYKLTENYNNEKFQKLASQSANEIHNRLIYYKNSVLQTAAFFSASENVTDNEFHNYVKDIDLERRYPGVTGLGYVEFNSNQSKVPIKYYQSYTDYDKKLKGADLAVSFSAVKAMEESIISGSFSIVEDIGQNKEFFFNKKLQNKEGILILYPVYNENFERLTLRERKLAIKGFVFGVFNTNHLFNSIIREIKNLQNAMGFEVSISSEKGDKTLFDSREAQKTTTQLSKYNANFSFRAGNRYWKLRVFSLPYLEGLYEQTIPIIIFFLGLAIAAIIFYFQSKLHETNILLKNKIRAVDKAAKVNALIAKASEDLGKSMDTEVNLKKLSKFLANNFAEFCVVEYFEKDGNQKYIEICNAMGNEKGLARKRLKSMAGDFVDKKQLITLTRKEDKFICDSCEDDSTFKSYASIPISHRGELYAIANLLDRKDKSKFFKKQESLLSHIAKIEAVALENTILYNEAHLANKLKDEFLATVSHELRTPLSVIQGHSELLLEEKLPEDQKAQIKSILTAAKNQGTIIEDLLDVTSIIAGKIAYSPRPVKVLGSIDTAISSLLLEAKKKNIKIESEDVSQCIVMGVKTRLSQIFWNLLSNAIKFTPEGGKIIVRSEVENENCIIKIIDTGKGIDPQFIPHIFEKFKQEEFSGTRNKGGLGLGLSIVSQLVALHGGSIKAESEGIGKGSTFTVTLPTVSLTTRTGPIDQSTKLKEIEKEDLHNISVLAVDDEPESLKLISKILRSKKATVITAQNGIEALRKIKTERPDIMISDIAMPEMDGYELIKELRYQEKARGTHIPAIALTAFAQDVDKERALRSGYEAYLSKPVNKDILINTVGQALH